MRIVKFPFVGNPIDYSPYGGVSQFKNTLLVDDFIVGEYFGEADVATLPNYDEEWPVINYRTEVISDEFISLFAGEEWAEVVLSSNPDVMSFKEQLVNRVKSFDTTHQRVTDGMTAIVQNTSMIASRAQEIVKGVKE